MSRTLFVSFTSALYNLQRGTATEADLATGLFAFGCTREHALHPGDGGEYVEDVVHERPDLHALLRRAVLTAEEDGRVAWRVVGENMSYRKISDLLSRNGYGPIAHEDWRAVNGDYCYPGVEDRVREAGHDLRVCR